MAQYVCVLKVLIAKIRTLVSMCAYIGVKPALVRAPENLAVRQGLEVTLDCTSDVHNSFLAWFNQSCLKYDAHDCIQSSIIYNGFGNGSIVRRFSVTTDDNATHVTRDVNIEQTQLTDAGVYVCVENIPPDGVKQVHSAQLVVLGMTNYAQ